MFSCFLKNHDLEDFEEKYDWKYSSSFSLESKQFRDQVTSFMEASQNSRIPFKSFKKSRERLLERILKEVQICLRGGDGKEDSEHSVQLCLKSVGKDSDSTENFQICLEGDGDDDSEDFSLETIFELSCKLFKPNDSKEALNLADFLIVYLNIVRTEVPPMTTPTIELQQFCDSVETKFVEIFEKHPKLLEKIIDRYYFETLCGKAMEKERGDLLSRAVTKEEKEEINDNYLIRALPIITSVYIKHRISKKIGECAIFEGFLSKRILKQILKTAAEDWSFWSSLKDSLQKNGLPHFENPFIVPNFDCFEILLDLYFRRPRNRAANDIFDDITQDRNMTASYDHFSTSSQSYNLETQGMFDVAIEIMEFLSIKNDDYWGKKDHLRNVFARIIFKKLMNPFPISHLSNVNLGEDYRIQTILYEFDDLDCEQIMGLCKKNVCRSKCNEKTET